MGGSIVMYSHVKPTIGDTDMNYKLAALGWDTESDNITNKFVDYENDQMAKGMGALQGPLGYATMKLINGNKNKHVEDLPKYDPKTQAYIGRSYKVPDTMDGLQALHELIVGEKWERSAPRIFEIFMKSRKDRVRDSIRDHIYKGKADVSKLSEGELASLVFPYILKQDGSIHKRLSMFKPYPISYGFNHRPINKKDLEER